MEENIIIIHNSKCRKSKAALEYLDEKKIKYKIKVYLKDNLTKNQLKDILIQLNLNPINLIRKKEEIFKQLKKLNQNPDNNQLLDWMVENPKLIERPIIINQKLNKAVIGRPIENIDKLI